ncbi:rod-binding protein [Microbulbifer thermotolerans]|uniref:rod-binding protein n=1 Tax=Microbulbifer thermotolerans TaxID=252514 RepID=UPI00224992CA|nr:rod-binding protein [Microbulbifer thermotolerans]MCX2780109.1 rod-binding protein [Microbulbifer thermotolerans]MCX2805533.1 rod-binding protein [Microbulbifer thermotolerans]MCX2831940.1 rod-binding protein [Microbulbifer thermotolerans]MCX2842495.1 rod-binding protein [Microbulbifer thermotolerans]
MDNALVSGHFALDVQGLERLKNEAAEDPQKNLRAAAEQFEALFLQQLMKSMREATPRSGLIDNTGIRFYESLYDQQLSQHLAGRGLGLAEQLVEQLSSRTGTAGK